MDLVTLLLFALSFVVVSTIWLYVLRPKPTTHLPPGPYPLPIIGNILQLGHNPHISLTKLSKIYGPLMYLKLGSVNIIVVSSPGMAKQVLQTHDQALSDRFIPIAMEACNRSKFSMPYLPTGNKWRKYRKLCKERIFSTPRLDASESLRQDKLKKLCDYVEKCLVNGRVVDIGEAVYTTSLNFMSATLFSMEFARFETGSIQEMKELIGGYLRAIGTPNLADFFPVLRVIDPQGIKKKSEIYAKKLISMIEDIINERLMESRDKCLRKDDLLEVLVDPTTQGSYEHDLSRVEIIHFLMFLVVQLRKSFLHWISHSNLHVRS